MTPRSLVLALAFTLAATSVHAQTMDPAPSAKGAKPLVLKVLKPGQLAPQWLLPAPPAEGSAQTMAELAEVHAVIAHASPQARARAEADGETENAGFLADTVPGFDLTHLPAAKALFDAVRNDENAEAKAFKSAFPRPRPYQSDATVTPCKDEIGNKAPTSYPSGHATMGYAMAVVLANLVPEKAPAIMARAKLYAENRLVCGVHYRSDIVAGETLGTAVAVLLLQDVKFQQDMAAARAELLKAGVTKGE